MKLRPDNCTVLYTVLYCKVWPGSTDPLAASWAFTLSLHSLWSLPITVLQQGGLAFLLAYTLTLAILGAPLLLTEMFLGQVRLFNVEQGTAHT